MKIDYTKPIRTKRYKTPVTILYTNGRGNFPIGGYIGNTENIQFWTKDGGFKESVDGAIQVV